MTRRKRGFCYALGVVMTLAGLNHFLNPDAYEAMVPRELPSPRLLVYVSGVAEIAGALGLFHPRTRKLAAWGLVLLYVAVFPANINMAVNHLSLDGREVPSWALWARLPLQAVFIAWAFWMTRDDSEQQELQRFNTR
jgi:uncharacterized membrane protein